MKPTIIRNRQFYTATNHIRSKQLGATLSKDLREKYGKHNTRVVKGDTVRIMRGEFKGIDGKVTQISTEKSGVAVEGIKREKLKGGNVDIYIHTSNVMITGLNLDDKWRQSRLEGQKTKVATEPLKETPKESPKEVLKPKELPTKESQKPKEKPKETPKEKSKEKPKPKEKTSKPSTKKTKQTKAANQAKKETE